jgi:hypothetical protein
MWVRSSLNEGLLEVRLVTLVRARSALLRCGYSPHAALLQPGAAAAVQDALGCLGAVRLELTLAGQPVLAVGAGSGQCSAAKGGAVAPPAEAPGVAAATAAAAAAAAAVAGSRHLLLESLAAARLGLGALRRAQHSSSSDNKGNGDSDGDGGLSPVSEPGDAACADWWSPSSSSWFDPAVSGTEDDGGGDNDAGRRPSPQTQVAE